MTSSIMILVDFWRNILFKLENAMPHFLTGEEGEISQTGDGLQRKMQSREECPGSKM